MHIFGRQLESLTADWFYFEIGKKYKRCGGAKIIHELDKREKEHGESNYTSERKFQLDLMYWLLCFIYD